MPVEAIEQASCTECDTDDATIEREGREVSSAREEVSYITYKTKCDECSATGGVSITEDGLRSTEELSYEDASWNQDEDDSDDDDEGDSDE
jgi:hypothetical protein